MLLNFNRASGLVRDLKTKGLARLFSRIGKRIVDYVDKFSKKLKKNKLISIVIIVGLVIIGIATVLGVLTDIFEIIFIPSSNLDVVIHGSKIDLVKSPGNTTVIGFNTTVISQMTNFVEIPITIIACDVFQEKKS